LTGEVLASLRFEIESCEWVLLPRLEGARRLFEGRDKKNPEEIGLLSSRELYLSS